MAGLLLGWYSCNMKLGHQNAQAWKTAYFAGLLLLATNSANVAAHPDHAFGKPLHAVSLDEARKLANAECKIVFVYITEADGKIPAYLDNPTWDDWELLDLLVRETVGVVLNKKQHAAELFRYEVSEFPAILLLDPDGTRRVVLPGQLPLDELIRRLAADLSGEDTITRARKSIAQRGKDDLFARERLAQALAGHSDYAAALAEYLWCLNVGLQQSTPYAAARRRRTLEGFRLFAESHPPAKTALLKWQEEKADVLRSTPDDHQLARTWAALNTCLDDEARTLVLLDELPQKCKARHILFDRSLILMVEKGRYREVLERIDPQRWFTQAATMVRMKLGQAAEGSQAIKARGTRSFTAARGAALVEALAATGRLAEARDLVEQILRFRDTPEIRADLLRRAHRIENPELVEYIEAR